MNVHEDREWHGQRYGRLKQAILWGVGRTSFLARSALAFLSSSDSSFGGILGSYAVYNLTMPGST